MVVHVREPAAGVRGAEDPAFDVALPADAAGAGCAVASADRGDRRGARAVRLQAHPYAAAA